MFSFLFYSFWRRRGFWATWIASGFLSPCFLFPPYAQATESKQSPYSPASAASPCLTIAYNYPSALGSLRNDAELLRLLGARLGLPQQACLLTPANTARWNTSDPLVVLLEGEGEFLDPKVIQDLGRRSARTLFLGPGLAGLEEMTGWNTWLHMGGGLIPAPTLPVFYRGQQLASPALEWIPTRLRPDSEISKTTILAHFGEDPRALPLAWAHLGFLFYAGLPDTRFSNWLIADLLLDLAPRKPTPSRCQTIVLTDYEITSNDAAFRAVVNDFYARHCPFLVSLILPPSDATEMQLGKWSLTLRYAQERGARFMIQLDRPDQAVSKLEKGIDLMANWGIPIWGARLAGISLSPSLAKQLAPHIALVVSNRIGLSDNDPDAIELSAVTHHQSGLWILPENLSATDVPETSSWHLLRQLRSTCSTVALPVWQAPSLIPSLLAIMSSDSTKWLDPFLFPIFALSEQSRITTDPTAIRLPMSGWIESRFSNQLIPIETGKASIVISHHP